MIIQNYEKLYNPYKLSKYFNFRITWIWILILAASSVTSRRSPDRSWRDDIKRPCCSAVRNRKIKSSASVVTLWSYRRLIEELPRKCKVAAAKNQLTKITKVCNGQICINESHQRDRIFVTYHFHKQLRRNWYSHIDKYGDSIPLYICLRAYKAEDYHDIELAFSGKIFVLIL